MNRKDKAVFSRGSFGIRSVIFLLLAGSWNMAASQQLLREVIGSAGGSAGSLGSVQISWTVGEPVAGTIEGDGAFWIQGFEQPFPLEAVLECQQIALQTGWNMISAYALPPDPDLDAAFSGVASEIILAKDEAGRIYLPGIFNQIGDWGISEGYQVKSWSDTVLTVGCAPIDPATTAIPLNAGWNLASYLRTGPMSPDQAWGELGDTLLIGKDNAGNVYIPVFGLNTIGDLMPGQGYQMKLSRPADLYYPANDARYAAPSIAYRPQTPAQTLRVTVNTGSNATIVVPEGAVDGLMTGDEIGVFNGRGLLCGSAMYEGRHLVVTVWGNEVTEGDEDHFAEGEPYRFRIWRPDDAAFYDLEGVAMRSGPADYRQNGVSVLEAARLMDKGLVSSPYVHTWVWPNPAAHVVHIEGRFPVGNSLELEVCSLSGVPVYRERLGPGTGEVFRVSLAVGTWPMGQYIWKLRSGQALAVGKFSVSGIGR